MYTLLRFLLPEYIPEVGIIVRILILALQIYIGILSRKLDEEKHGRKMDALLRKDR